MISSLKSFDLSINLAGSPGRLHYGREDLLEVKSVLHFLMRDKGSMEKMDTSGYSFSKFSLKSLILCGYLFLDSYSISIGH
jgi:hypothetical protein